MNKYLLLSAGDPSGDIHGAHLIQAIRDQTPSLKIAVVGGRQMQRQADEVLFDMESHYVFGLEPLKKIPLFLNLLKKLNLWMQHHRPVAIVPIDFYGFHRRLLSLAKRHKVPSFYFIGPQVWASRPWRMKALGRLVTRMLMIFPFEEEIYKKSGLPATFVGHPLLDLIEPPPHRNGANFRNVPGHVLKLGLLPGSRPKVIQRHLLLFLKALERIRQRLPNIEPRIFAVPSLPDAFYHRLISQATTQEFRGRLIRETDYRSRAELDFAICASGTATLENALLGIPEVVVYKLSWPFYAAAKALIRVPYISMANLLAGREIVEELIQSRATPASIAEAVLRRVENPSTLGQMRQELLRLRPLLGEPGAYQRAASVILEGAN